MRFLFSLLLFNYRRCITLSQIIAYIIIYYFYLLWWLTLAVPPPLAQCMLGQPSASHAPEHHKCLRKIINGCQRMTQRKLKNKTGDSKNNYVRRVQQETCLLLLFILWSFEAKPSEKSEELLPLCAVPPWSSHEMAVKTAGSFNVVQPSLRWLRQLHTVTAS